MRAIVLKLFCWLCLTMVITTNVLAYQNTNSKTAYIESQWRHKLTNTKDHHNRNSNNNINNKNNNHNRYASLLMGSSSSSSSNSNSGSISGTTNSKPEYKYDNNDHNKNKQTTHSNSYSYNSNPSVRIRHSNKYPNLNNIWTRLDKMQPTATTTPPPPPATSPYPYQSRYHYQNIKNSDKLFYNNNYNTDDIDDFDYEDEDESTEKDTEDLEPDYDKWETEEENKNDDDFDDDEDDLVDDEDEEEENGWQAEEATEASPSSLTEYKWQHYGTRSRVEESRRNQYPEHVNSYSDIRAAIEHTLKMDKETRCRDPSPRIISVQSIHPDPGKSYLPHCTVLHRCAEDTGCCSNHAMKCGPKRQNLVYLYFYTTTIGKTGSKVEKLPFYNHTDCACVDKSSEPSALDFAASEEENNQEVLRSYRSSLSVRAADTSHPQTIRRCKCPEEYTSRLYRGFHCKCDCVEGNLDCAQMKAGKEFFSLKDRLCILNEECGTPSCDYGSYMRNIGRCPRKQEKFDAFANASADIQ